MKSKQEPKQEFGQERDKHAETDAARATAEGSTTMPEEDMSADVNASGSESERPDSEAESFAAEIVMEADADSGPQSQDHGGTPDTKDAQISDLTQQLLRTRADFENLRRRTRQEKADLQQFATKKLLGELLPVVDNFERALSSFSADATVSEELKSGIEMVHRQLLGVLEQQGVKTIVAVGQSFDPNFHEAVMQEPVEGKAEGEVIAELQKGYTLHEKVLRPAMVKVTS